MQSLVFIRFEAMCFLLAESFLLSTIMVMVMVLISRFLPQLVQNSFNKSRNCLSLYLVEEYFKIDNKWAVPRKM